MTPVISVKRQAIDTLSVVQGWETCKANPANQMRKTTVSLTEINKPNVTLALIIVVQVVIQQDNLAEVVIVQRRTQMKPPKLIPKNSRTSETQIILKWLT